MYTEFDKRMKGYERQFNVALDPYEPVIVRVDGRCFHTFTKNFQKPFDDVLSRTMRDTMQYLCENVQGCVLGYTQSDEILRQIPEQGYLTISKALQWRLQYARVIGLNNRIEGVINYEW